MMHRRVLGLVVPVEKDRRTDRQTDRETDKGQRATPKKKSACDCAPLYMQSSHLTLSKGLRNTSIYTYLAPSVLVALPATPVLSQSQGEEPGPRLPHHDGVNGLQMRGVGQEIDMEGGLLFPHLQGYRHRCRRRKNGGYLGRPNCI